LRRQGRGVKRSEIHDIILEEQTRKKKQQNDIRAREEKAVCKNFTGGEERGSSLRRPRYAQWLRPKGLALPKKSAGFIGGGKTRSGGYMYGTNRALGEIEERLRGEVA